MRSLLALLRGSTRELEAGAAWVDDLQLEAGDEPGIAEPPPAERCRLGFAGVAEERLPVWRADGLGRRTLELANDGPGDLAGDLELRLMRWDRSGERVLATRPGIRLAALFQMRKPHSRHERPQHQHDRQHIHHAQRHEQAGHQRNHAAHHRRDQPRLRRRRAIGARELIVQLRIAPHQAERRRRPQCQHDHQRAEPNHPHDLDTAHGARRHGRAQAHRVQPDQPQEDRARQDRPPPPPAPRIRTRHDRLTHAVTFR